MNVIVHDTKIPLGYEETRDEWEAKGFGACGPSVIACATHKPVQEIIDHWLDDCIPPRPYTGTANVRDMELELEKYRFKTKRFPGRKSKQIFIPEGYLHAVAFIQWGEHKHWIEAQKNTHWIYLMVATWKSGGLLVFCNGQGWFNADSPKGRAYLENGHVRSVIGISSM